MEVSAAATTMVCFRVYVRRNFWSVAAAVKSVKANTMIDMRNTNVTEGMEPPFWATFSLV